MLVLTPGALQKNQDGGNSVVCALPVAIARISVYGKLSVQCLPSAFLYTLKSICKLKTELQQRWIQLNAIFKSKKKNPVSNNSLNNIICT